MADEVKQVKVDNWGIYFLQRLKHFFNRTDYCDLTLQFQDNAQLKVHRLVLSACTEYFELLERTCEMYEDCLVMPEDLQADIVVPIVNFMYTGQLEFRMELLERLYQCSEIMHMPVLTKLLDSHRPKLKFTQSTPIKKVVKRVEGIKETVKSISSTEIVTTSPVTYKRNHNKAFEQTTVYRDKKIYLPMNKTANNAQRLYPKPDTIPLDLQRFNKKVVSGDPRPTRYELPEELDTDNIFESSFCNISYTTQPLIVHPDTKKKYGKRPKLSNEASSSKKFGGSTVEIMPCKKPIQTSEETLFEDPLTITDESDMFSEQYTNSKPGSSRDPNQLFDQILEKPDDTKVVIETKNAKSTGNLDHAKIISEVLKKYPHLVKSNKNIKLKILNMPNKNAKKQKPTMANVPKVIKTEKDVDFTFETDVLDSMQAAKLIAMGAENIEGPWICLICGTPGKAMNFTSYYKFRRHLVEVHNEKPVLNICEYCGQKSTKRNYLLHHLYTKHGVEPPPQYRFPKCPHCNYIALTEALLVKHKLTHVDIKKFRCNVCPAAFHSSNQLLTHIQNTGHKYTAERKSNFQCIYCQKVFQRESNLCAHLKTSHRSEAIQDGIIDDSDDEMPEEKKAIVKSEPIINDFQELDIQYQIQQRADGFLNIVTKTGPDPVPVPASVISAKQTILNSGLSSQAQPVLTHINKSPKKPHALATQREFIQDVDMTTCNDTLEEIVMIDNIEYIMRNNQLIPRGAKQVTEEYILSDQGLQSMETSTSMEFTNIQNVQQNMQHANMILKNPDNLGETIPIYVSNEEEYKALMASNQPIIFDSGDSNKTLTVLTAPHSSSLDTTTINLDTTQANDMMIIQDNYPLNVSEAVPSENSNIVVVYSHPVDGQSKQYQLLTTQGLGAQFVQSSTIITQNFETITTTAPIMNTHGIEKQDQQVWQTNLDQIVNTEQMEITPVAENEPIQKPTNQVQVSNSSETNNGINDLPEVELSPNIAQTAGKILTAANQIQGDMAVEDVTLTDSIEKNTEVECEDNEQTMSIMEISEEAPTEHPIEETIGSNETTDNPIENIIESEEIDTNDATAVENAELIESQTFTQPDHMGCQTYTQQDPNIEHVENIEKIAEQEQTEVVNHKQIENQENSNEQVGPVTDVCEVSDNPDQIVDEIEITEKAQTLNAEWSEESIQEETSVHNTALDNSAEISNQQDNMVSSEIEESIENIQQEVDKQIAEATAKEYKITDEARPTEHDITDEARPTEHEITDESRPSEHVIRDEVEDVANSSQDESDSVLENTEAVSVDPVVAQEKISSLLNDWEDNDSQGENDSANDNAPIETDEAVDNAPAETPEKQDKIRSLVSDWDEDEEENKE